MCVGWGVCVWGGVYVELCVCGVCVCWVIYVCGWCVCVSMSFGSGPLLHVERGGGEGGRDAET